MIFTVEQVRLIRQVKMTAVLVSLSERVQPGRIRLLRRRTRPGEDGQPPPRPVETVTELIDGERTAVVITILAVRDLEPAVLTIAEARLCGFRTADELREAWAREHPGAPLARMVRFAVGDLRDSPRLVSRGWPDYTSDPSRAMFGSADPGEALTREELAAVAGVNHQNHLRHRAQLATELAAGTAAQRLERIQKAGEQMRLDLRRELRVIEERIIRAENRSRPS